MVNEFHVPTKVRFGAGSSVALDIPAGDILFVASASVPTATVEILKAAVAQKGGVLHEVGKPSGEPWSKEVNELFSKSPLGVKAVIGIGGGSTLDIAKALALLAISGGRIEEYEFGARSIHGALPVFLIPTTCGSGSEMTPYTVINNSDTGRKFTLAHPTLRAHEAAIDPELLVGLPKEVMLASALDAFIHCLEALLNRTGNRLADPFSEAGLRIGWDMIPRVGREVTTPESRERLATLSLYGGLSIAHNRTGLIHTLSVAIAEFSKLPHGFLNACIMPFVLEYMASSYGGRLAGITASMGKPTPSDAEAAHVLAAWVRELTKGTSIATKDEILQRKEKVVARVIQDKGLPGVSYAPVDSGVLSDIVERIAYAS
jgi:alcohol dehydrogenase class IV